MLNAKQVNVRGCDVFGNKSRITLSNEKTDELHIHADGFEIYCSANDLVHAIMLLTINPECSHRKEGE